jgi:LysR family transcriptional regulator, transcriptional activator of nhaA
MNWMNYNHLYYFWVLAQSGTFTAASEKLSIAQSALSSQIKTLEDSLGLNLIDRTNKRKPNLTEEGQRVLEYAQTIFETGTELLEWAKGSEKGQQTIRIGALSGLSRNFQYEFLKPLIDTKLVLQVTTGDQERLTRLLKEHAIDLFLSSHQVSPDGLIQFESQVLTSSPVIFVIQKNQQKKNWDLKDYLKNYKVYLPSKNFEAHPELKAYLSQFKDLKIAGEMDDIALLRLFAIKSNQIVAIPEMGVLNDLQSKEIIKIAQSSKIKQSFYAITRSRKYPNQHVKNLISLMKST